MAEPQSVIDVEQLVGELKQRVDQGRATGLYADDLSGHRLQLGAPGTNSHHPPEAPPAALPEVRAQPPAVRHPAPHVVFLPTRGYRSPRFLIGWLITFFRRLVLRLVTPALDDLARQADAAMLSLHGRMEWAESALAAETAAREGAQADLQHVAAIVSGLQGIVGELEGRMAAVPATLERDLAEVRVVAEREFLVLRASLEAEAAAREALGRDTADLAAQLGSLQKLGVDLTVLRASLEAEAAAREALGRDTADLAAQLGSLQKLGVDLTVLRASLEAEAAAREALAQDALEQARQLGLLQPMSTEVPALRQGLEAEAAAREALGLAQAQLAGELAARDAGNAELSARFQRLLGDVQRLGDADEQGRERVGRLEADTRALRASLIDAVEQAQAHFDEHIESLVGDKDAMQLRASQLVEHLRAFESSVSEQLAAVSRQFEELESGHLEQIRKHLEELETGHLEQIRQQLEGLETGHFEKIRNQFRHLDERVSAVGGQADRLTVKLQPLEPPRALVTTDAEGREVIGYRNGGGPAGKYLYRDFEDVFRQDQDTIRERQRVYVEYVAAAPPVLDLGCGRGEFLDLLDEAGIEARGVDVDGGMVAVCREKGHAVEQADAITYLEGQADGSLGAIFCAQVIEHLSYVKLNRLLELAQAKLKRGGILIAESVNPHSMIAFRAFWLDPTHRAPLYPETVVLLCRLHGFSSAKALFPQGGRAEAGDRVEAPDYAVVAKKE